MRQAGDGTPSAWQRRFGAVAVVFGLLCCAAAPLNATLSPVLNWDMLAYIGIIKSYSVAAPDAYQAAAYDDLHRFADARHLKDFAPLVDGSEYRRAVSAEPATFAEQLPFYRIRVLYLGVVAAVSLATTTIAAACVAVSAVSALLTNLLIAVTGWRGTGLLQGSLIAAAAGLSPIAVDLAQSKTPDALFTLAVGCGVLLLARGRDLAGALVLVAAVAIRSDGMLLDCFLALALGTEYILAGCGASSEVAPVVSAERWTPPVRSKLRSRTLLAAILLLVGSVGLEQVIVRSTGGYSYRILYAFTFVGIVPHPAALADVSIPVSKIAAALTKGISGALANGGLWSVLVEAVIIGMIVLRQSRLLRNRLTILALGLLGFVACRFALFPEADLRLNAPVFVALAILIIRLMAAPDETAIFQSDYSTLT